MPSDPDFITRLTAPLDSTHGACGSDPKNDLSFANMKSAAQRRQGQTDPDGNPTFEDPRWPEVHDLGLALFESTRDLRVAVLLCGGLLHKRKLAGLADGLAVAQTLLSTFGGKDEAGGTALHPRADGLRIAALEQLASAELVELLRSTVAQVIEGGGDLGPQRAALGECLASIEALHAACPSAELDNVRNAIAAALEAMGGAAPAARSASPRTDGATPAPDGATTVPGQRETDRQLDSPKDVRRELSRLCEYYRRKEPSSPLLILLEFTSRAVEDDLLTILEKIDHETLKKFRQS